MEGFPFFVERGANPDGRLTSEGSHTTTVRSVATITTRGVVGHLMAPMLKFQMTSLMRKTLRPGALRGETGTPHPRKVKALASKKLARPRPTATAQPSDSLLETADMQSEYQLTLPPQTAEARTSPSSPARWCQGSFGFVPNMYANMANGPGLLEAYLHGYELFRATSGFTPVEQEVVFLSINRQKRMRILHGVQLCRRRDEQRSPSPSRTRSAMTSQCRMQLAALADFSHDSCRARAARASGRRRRLLRGTPRNACWASSCRQRQDATTFSNHLFHTPVDPAFAARVWNCRQWRK